MADSSSTAVEYTDVIVVGARCAGSAVAMTMARAGRRVIVLDSAQFPSDTLSTHLLWPGGLAELDALGVLDQVEELGAPRLTSAFAAGAGYRVPSEFAPADGIDYAMCVRRTGLDAVLVGAARSAGAEVRERCRVLELVWADDRCAGVRYRDRADAVVELRAPLVVGADGRRSTVARLCGAIEPFLHTPSGRECYYAYWREGSPSWRHIAAQWRAGRDLGTAFPCDDGLVLSLVQPPVSAEPALGPGRAEQRYAEAIARIPGLAERLRDCERVGRVRAATGIASYFRRSSGPGWAWGGGGRRPGQRNQAPTNRTDTTPTKQPREPDRTARGEDRTGFGGAGEDAGHRGGQGSIAGRGAIELDLQRVHVFRAREPIGPLIDRQAFA
ncbi:NAD(P)/FAD-dependent oxidoreductase [Nocardia cyriacigeorgica]|uniref:NAD(P)/FAD-dependent oxidoreductase n=1 Tax=Nocardia cyriacigeorgica TaxID=135487 RepID=UPI0024537C53|nr:FAD-dependent monooxygenase [Nocardia cyriacigeorgica]